LFDVQSCAFRRDKAETITAEAVTLNFAKTVKNLVSNVLIEFKVKKYLSTKDIEIGTSAVVVAL